MSLEPLITLDDLRARYGKPGEPLCTRQVRRVLAQMGIKPVRPGFYRPATVLRAEERAEQGEANRKTRKTRA